MNWESSQLSDARTETGVGLVASPEGNRSDSVRVLILGLGNVLLKDEGVGVHVAQLLAKEKLPGNVEVIDGGTAGLDVLLSQHPPYKLVVIDAVKAGNKPGTVYKTRLNLGPTCGPREKRRAKYLAQQFIAGSSANQSKISLHQVGVIDALKAAEIVDRVPDEIVVIGVEPAEVRFGLELTEPVKQSVPRAVEQVLREIENAVHGK
jgi:hydrogenase maturation protease